MRIRQTIDGPSISGPPPRVEISEAALDQLGFLKLAELAVKTHGPVVTLVLPRGGRTMTLLAASAHVRFWQNNEEIFQKDHTNARSGAAVMHSMLGSTLQTSGTGDEWQTMRKEMTNLLGSTKAWFQRPLKTATERLISDLLADPAQPLHQLCLRWATRAICDPLFQNPDLEPLAQELLDCLDQNFYQRLAAVPFSQSEHQIDEMIGAVMCRVAHGRGQESIAETILASDEYRGNADEKMRRIVTGLLTASLHMNGTILFWAMLHLAEHADLQRRIAAEATPFGMEPRRVTQTPLAFAALRESLRLNPVTAFIERQMARRIELDGYRLEAGQSVLFSPWLVHRDPSDWEDPIRFDPTRFLGKRVVKPGAYLPFGVGRRTCPGASIVNQQLTYALSIISQRLALTRSPQTRPGDKKPVFRIVLEPRGSVRLQVVPLI